MPLHRNAAWTAAGLIAVAGLAQAQSGSGQGGSSQNNQKQYQNQNQAGGMTGAQTGLNQSNTGLGQAEYRSWAWLNDADVVNANGEEIADIEDLIIDRGSGRIEMVVLRTGSVLGLGGRTFTVPFDEFQWNAQTTRLTLNSDASQLGRYPTYNTDEWKSLRNSAVPPEWRHRSGYDRGYGDQDRGGNYGGTGSPGTGTGGPRSDATDPSGRTRVGTGSDQDRNRTGTGTGAGTGTSGTGTGTGTGTSGTGTGTSGSGTGQTGSGGTGTSGTGTSGTGTSGTGTSGTGTGQSGTGTGQTGTGAGQPGQQTGMNQPGANQQGMNQNQQGLNQPGATGQSQTLSDWMWRNTQPDNDAYTPQWGSAQAETITGQIRSVTRQGQHVIVEVQTQDGMTRHVALGPSWFISGNQTALNRGDTIRVEAVPLVVARSAEINGQRIELRDPQGAAAWSQGQFRAGEESYSAPYYRYLRVSDLVGAEIDCRGTDCGSVNDLILEVASGSVAFLSIDPDDNFLGIGDTNRLVPWTVANVSVNGTVRLDVTKEMMTSTMETPTDAASLNAQGAVDRIYNAYGVPANRWEPRQRGYYNRGWGDDDRNWQYGGSGQNRDDRKDKDRDR